MFFSNETGFACYKANRDRRFPGKDVIYRFLNHPQYAWRRFLHALSLHVVRECQSLTSSSRVRVFTVDDSVIHRNRNKAVELLARLPDHVTGRFVRGYSMLTLGLSDGCSFVPIDFHLLSSAKAENRLCGMMNSLDRRTHGYKRRQEALFQKPAAAACIDQDGQQVIGMVKPLKQHYL